MGPWPAIYIKQVTTRSSTRTTSEKGGGGVAVGEGEAGERRPCQNQGSGGAAQHNAKPPAREMRQKPPPRGVILASGGSRRLSQEKRKWRPAASAPVLRPIVFKVRGWHRAPLEGYWVRRYGGKWGAGARDVRWVLIGLTVKERKRRRKNAGNPKAAKKGNKKKKENQTQLRNLLKVLRCVW